MKLQPLYITFHCTSQSTFWWLQSHRHFWVVAGLDPNLVPQELLQMNSVNLCGKMICEQGFDFSNQSPKPVCHYLCAGIAEKLGGVGKSGDLGPQPTECWPLMAPDGAAVKRSPFLLPIPGLAFYTFCRLASLQEGGWGDPGPGVLWEASNSHHSLSPSEESFCTIPPYI